MYTESNFFSEPFTLCLDEATDVSKDKMLAIIVRYVDRNNGEVRSQLWETVPIYNAENNDKPPGDRVHDVNAGSQTIFDCVATSFTSKGIPLSNIFACCYDCCNTMIGEKSK